MRSSDGAKSWAALDIGIGSDEHFYPILQAISGSVDDVWMSASIDDETGVLLNSKDHGQSWKRHGIGAADVLTGLWSDGKGTVYATAFAHGLYSSSDDGQTFQR